MSRNSIAAIAALLALGASHSAFAVGYVDFLVKPQTAPPVVISAPQPGTMWNATVYFDLRTHATAGVIMARFTTITFPSLRRFSVDLNGFGGVAINGGNAISGIALTKSFTIATTPAGPVELIFGVAGSATQSKQIGVGLILGGSIRF